MINNGWRAVFKLLFQCLQGKFNILWLGMQRADSNIRFELLHFEPEFYNKNYFRNIMNIIVGAFRIEDPVSKFYKQKVLLFYFSRANMKFQNFITITIIWVKYI